MNSEPVSMSTLIRPLEKIKVSRTDRDGRSAYQTGQRVAAKDAVVDVMTRPTNVRSADGSRTLQLQQVH